MDLFQNIKYGVHMKKKNSLLIVITIITLTLSVVLSTYAYFSVREVYEGTFKVDVTSKGVDTLQFSQTNARFVADSSNFAINVGHDVSGTANLNVILDTTNPQTKYCYVLKMKLPEEQVFSYTVVGVPELVLDVSKSNDGINYNPIIREMDITTMTGDIEIPVSTNSNDYLHVISTTKNYQKIDYWQAKITFKWLKDDYQYINDYKSYEAVFKANIVEC